MVIRIDGRDAGPGVRKHPGLYGKGFADSHGIKGLMVFRADRLRPPDPGHAFVYQRFLFPRASRLIRDIPGIYVDYGPRCGMGGNDGGGAEPESLYRS